MNENDTKIAAIRSEATASTKVDGSGESCKMQLGNSECDDGASTTLVDQTESIQYTNNTQTKIDTLEQEPYHGEAEKSPGVVFARNDSKSVSNLNAKVLAKQTASPLKSPRQLESALQSKVARSVSRSSTPTSLRDMESLVRFNQDGNTSAGTAINVLGAKKALKSSESMTGSAPRVLQDFESAVTSKTGSNIDAKDTMKHPASRVQQEQNVTTKVTNVARKADQNDSDKDAKKFETTTSAIHYCDDESGLAVALAVDEEDDIDFHLPSAVEYDPDAKPPVYKNRRFRIYALLLVATAIIGVIGAVVGITVVNNVESTQSATPIPYRATIGIRETLAQFIPEEYFDDVQSPYRKALDWITFIDPMAITPENPQFVQRYLLANLYYATSVQTPWTSGCAPSDSEPDQCKYTYIRTLRPVDDRFEKTGLRWLSNTNECKWAGIQCDGFSQISMIDFGGMGLTGTFPEDIVWLPYLSRIIIGFETIDGPLPEYLGYMNHLVDLELPGNRLTGTFPDAWLDSRMMNKFNLEDNQITGTISEAFGSRIELRELILRANNVTGTIPNELGNCLNIKHLRLDTNRITGTFPSTLGQMERIVIFDISNNFITGTIPEEVGNWTTNGEFFISNNNLNGTIPETFWNAKRLIAIDMSDNQLSGTISGKISTLSDLISISLENNQLTGAFPGRLGQTDIKFIYASGNQFTGTVPAQLCDLVAAGRLTDLEFDCAAPVVGGGGDVPEIICPDECCSLCCRPDGDNCVAP